MSAAGNNVRATLATVATSELVRTLALMGAEYRASSTLLVPPLFDKIRRWCKEPEERTEAFMAICHELDMRVPVR